MANPWFRVYAEIIRDRKLRRAAARAGVDRLTMLGAFVSLLCIANDSPVPGKLYVTLQERFSNDDVADELEISNDAWNGIAESLIVYDMLEIGEDGAYSIKNWGKRQFLSDNSTKRVQKLREKRSMKRYSNAPDTDTDTDTESIAPDGATKTPEQDFYKDPPAPRKPRTAEDIKAGVLRAIATGEARHSDGRSDVSMFPEHLWGLANEFMDASGLSPHKSEYKLWIKELTRIYDQGYSVENISKAVRKLRNDGMTIKGPGSIYGTMGNLQAKADDDEVFAEVW